MQLLPLNDYRLHSGSNYYVACMMEGDLPQTEITDSMDDILNNCLNTAILRKQTYGMDSHRYLQQSASVSDRYVSGAVFAAHTQVVSGEGYDQVIPKLKMRTDFLPLSIPDFEAERHAGARLATIMNHRSKDVSKNRFASTSNMLFAEKIEGDIWQIVEYDFGAPISISKIGIVGMEQSTQGSSPFNTAHGTKLQAYVEDVWQDVANGADWTYTLSSTTTESFNDIEETTAQKFRLVSTTVPTETVHFSVSGFVLRFFGTYQGQVPRELTEPKHMIAVFCARNAGTTLETANTASVSGNCINTARDRLVQMYGFSITDDITLTPTTDVFVPDLEYKAGNEARIPHFHVTSGIVSGEGV